MEKSIIQQKNDWSATLRMISINESAHFLKKKGEGIFRANVTIEGIKVTRVA